MLGAAHAPCQREAFLGMLTVLGRLLHGRAYCPPSRLTNDISFGSLKALPTLTMASPETEQQMALQGEIARLIAMASASRVVLRVTEEADRLGRLYPACGLSTNDIAAIIVSLAKPAKIALELDGMPQPTKVLRS